MTDVLLNQQHKEKVNEIIRPLNKSVSTNNTNAHKREMTPGWRGINLMENTNQMINSSSNG